MLTELEAFTRQVEAAEREGVTHVAIDRRLARRMLDDLTGPKWVPAVGDTVEVTATDSAYQGRQGTIVNIEALAERYHYSVSIPSYSGTGPLVYTAPIAYFAEADLKKVGV